MTGYDNRGARFPLTIVRGADLAFELTVTDANAAAVNLSAATIAGELYTTAGVLVDTLTAVVSGAGSNIVTLSLTDTETTALTATAYRWTLWVTRGGDKRPWLAGDVYMGDGTTGQSGSTSGSQALTVDGDLSVSISVNAIGSATATIRVEDEGVSTVAAATALNFTGTGVTVTDAGSGEATVSISSGGSGANLAWVAASSTVTSDTGTDATLTAVDASNPGLMTVAMKTKLDGIETGAQVVSTANVTAAGALMDSEVDADIKTLSLPASTTISVFGASLVDDADQATARTTLGLGTAATTASTDYATAAQGTTADGAIAKSIVAAKGDLIVATANDTVSVLTAGTNDYVLTADSAQATGLKWAAAAAGSGDGPGAAVLYLSSGRWYPSKSMGTSGTISWGADQTSFNPLWVPFNVTVDRIGTFSSGASVDCRLGIYEASATTGAPSTLVLDAGVVSMVGSGEKTITISQSLTGGKLYWIAAVLSGTCTVGRLAGGTFDAGSAGPVDTGLQIWSSFTYGAFPATWSASFSFAANTQAAMVRSA